VLLWAGWDDVVEKAELQMYANFQNAYLGRPLRGPMLADQPATGRYQIILGPWGHGGGLDNGIVLEWFDTWLKGEDTGMQDTSTPMHLFEQSSERWINAARYPLVANYTTLYLAADETLTVNAPPAPVNDRIVWAQPGPGAILSYTTQSLPDGATVAGPISVTVNASSSNTNMESTRCCGISAMRSACALPGRTLVREGGAVYGNLSPRCASLPEHAIIARSL